MSRQERHTREGQHRAPPGLKPNEKHVRKFQERELDIWEDITNSIHYEDLQEFVDHMSTIDFPLCYGYNGAQAAHIILHYMLFHDQCKTSDTNYEYGMPANGLKRMLDQIANKIEEFNAANIQWGTVEQRKEIARRGLPPQLQNPLATFIIDGTHIPVVYHQPTSVFGYNIDSNYLFKTGKKAVCYQVVINAMMCAIHTDRGQPAGVHDLRCVVRSDLERLVDLDEDVAWEI
jgi:hypothetical protein